jgi:hypothetical protein
MRFGLVTRALRTGLYGFELLPSFGDSFVCRPLFRGQGTGDGFDQLVLRMDRVRRVVGLKRVFHRGQQPGRFIVGRLNHPALALGQGRGHPCMPTAWIASLSPRFQKHAMALRGHGDEAQAPGTRCVLGDCEVFGGPARGQARGFRLARGGYRCLNLAVDALLSARGGRHKVVKAGQVEEETYQANAAGPDVDANEMAGNPEAV